MKKTVVFLMSFIAVLTVVFIVMGLLFDKDDNEKQAGLTDIYDVSAAGDVAYVAYERGVAHLFVTNKEQALLQLPVDEAILDIAYSLDGKQLAVAVSAKNLEEHEGTKLHVLQLDTLEDEVVYSVDGLITELVFDPKESSLLVFLQADTFTNYSPIASKNPHDFDVHTYDLNEKVATKQTNLKKYGMGSLQVSNQKNSIFVQMDDDEEVETAEDVFASSQRIFEIPLDNPNEKSIISSPTEDGDIYDFVILPDSEEIVYQAVAGTGENGIFEYELFMYNWKTEKMEQLTRLKKSASKPVYGPDDKIYFINDRAFGSRNEDNHLFKIDRDGKNVEEIQLKMMND